MKCGELKIHFSPITNFNFNKGAHCKTLENPLPSRVSLPKIAYFRIGNLIVSGISFRMDTN